MSTFYLDFEGGNDSNAGTSFALRWKTMTSGATAARIAPGDTIRIMASRDKANLGNGTWTDNSGTVTLAAAKTLTIWNGDAAWTGVSANITGSTSASNYKIGTTRNTATPAGAFTTGKMCYFTLPATLDLSSYQQVSFWFMGANVQYQLKLCSDATGDTPVNTLTIPAGVSGQWRRVVIDSGGALDASIASISLHASSDPGTTVSSVQNLIACLAPSASDCLTHLSLIGKDSSGEPEFFPLLSIDGTTVKLGGHYNISATATGSSGTPRKYRGTTETVTTYAQNPIQLLANSAGANSFTDEGTIAGGQITYSGGWNRTDMSTQTGETWVSGEDQAYQLSQGANRGLTVSKLNISHISGSALFNSSNSSAYGAPFIWTSRQMAACSDFAFYINGNASGCRYQLSVDHFVANESAVRLISSNPPFDLTFKTIKNSNTYGIQLAMGAEVTVKGDEISNCGQYGLFIASNANLFGRARFIGVTFKNNATADYDDSSGISCWPGTLNFINCEFLSTSGFVTNSSGNSWYNFSKYGKSSTDHRVVNLDGTIQSESSVRHTASGYSWKASPTNSTRWAAAHPFEIPLAKIAFNASAQVTITCYARRTNTGLTVGIKVKGYYIAGVDSDATVEMTAAADTWEQLTLTFTPTEAGAIEVFGYCYGGTTYSAYFDDLAFSQA